MSSFLPDPLREFIKLEMYRPFLFPSLHFRIGHSSGGLLLEIYQLWKWQVHFLIGTGVPCWRWTRGLSLSAWISGPHTWVLEKLVWGRAEQKLMRKYTEGMEDIPVTLKPPSAPSCALLNTLPSQKARDQRDSLILRKEFTILSAWGLWSHKDLSFSNLSSFNARCVTSSKFIYFTKAWHSLQSY